MVFDKILFQSTQPSRTDIAWAKPVKGGFALYLHFNGKWQPMKLMDDIASVTPDDDTVADVSNIREVVREEVQGSTQGIVQDEVTRQMAAHDEAVGDVHSTSSVGGVEYPDVTIFGSL